MACDQGNADTQGGKDKQVYFQELGANKNVFHWELRKLSFYAFEGVGAISYGVYTEAIRKIISLST